MANYKTIKQLRNAADAYDRAEGGGYKEATEFVESALRLGAAAEHRAIYSHIMKTDYSNATSDVACSQILTFMQGRKKRTEKAAGGLGKPNKAVKKKK